MLKRGSKVSAGGVTGFTKWFVALAATLLAVAALIGCDYRDYGSLGISTDVYAADVDPNKLCDWDHVTHGDDGNAYISVSCKSSRQVYTTCDIWLWPKFGDVSPIRVRTHGSQKCKAAAQIPYIDFAPISPAMGSIAQWWMRLDNPKRRWGFQDTGSAHCSVSRNADNQSILECGHTQGKTGGGCPCRALRAERKVARHMHDLISGLPSRTVSRVTRACASDARHLRPPTPGSRCTTAARQALRDLPPAQRERAQRYVTRHGLDLTN